MNNFYWLVIIKKNLLKYTYSSGTVNQVIQSNGDLAQKRTIEKWVQLQNLGSVSV